MAECKTCGVANSHLTNLENLQSKLDLMTIDCAFYKGVLEAVSATKMGEAIILESVSSEQRAELYGRDILT